jgi:hypothetical protein
MQGSNAVNKKIFSLSSGAYEGTGW